MTNTIHHLPRFQVDHNLSKKRIVVSNPDSLPQSVLGYDAAGAETKSEIHTEANVQGSTVGARSAPATQLGRRRMSMNAPREIQMRRRSWAFCHR